MDECIKLLQRIKEKGGMLGMAAEYVLIRSDEDKNLFLTECYQQLHVSALKKKWGKELINDVKNYVDKLNNNNKKTNKMKTTTTPKLMLLLSIILLSLSGAAQVVPNIDWVQHYSYRDSIENMSSAIDANNNVYVTGYVINTTTYDRDIITLKYDSLGMLQWAEHYDGGSGDDEGKSIKVDNAGNVFVCGYITDPSNGKEAFIIKYDAAGNMLWRDQFDSGNQLDDELVDMKINNATGDIFMVGTSMNSNWINDILVLHYDFGGTYGWHYLYDGQTNNDDIGVSIALTSNSDMYVSGNSQNNNWDYDICVFMLDANGGFHWDQYVVGSNGTDDLAYASVITGGDAVVCGRIGNNSDPDYTTFRINSSGSVLWQQNYDFNSTNDFATALVRDSTGNIAVTGLVNNSSTFEYHTIMYDSTGTQLWVNKQNTGIMGFIIQPRIACDTIAHHFYVSGTKESNSNTDLMVYQITPGGNTSWVETYDGPGNNLDMATALSVNGVGVVYLSGNCINSNWMYEITTVRISQTPVYMPVNYNLQTDTFSYSNLYYPNTGEILDTTGNVVQDVLYYTKFTYPNQYILKDRVVFCQYKKDTSNVNFSDTLNRTDMIFHHSNKYTKPYPINFQEDSYINYFLSHTGEEGKTNIKGASHLVVPNIYHAIDLHYTSNSCGSKYFFVIKPGGSPQQIFITFEGMDSANIINQGLNIFTKLGAWEFKSPDIYNVSFNYTTMAITTNSVTGTNGWQKISGNMYSINPGTYNNSFPLIVEFDMGKMPAVPPSSLNCKWSTYVGGANMDISNGLISDQDNNLFVMGSTISNNYPLVVGPNVFQSNSGGGYDGFLDKYDSDGKRLWSTFIGGTNKDDLQCVAFGSNGDLYLVGNTQSTLATFPKSGASNTLSPLGGVDVYILQVSSNSTVKKWLTYYGGSLNDHVSKCKFDNNGNFYIVGSSFSYDIPVVGSTPLFTQNNNGASNTTDCFLARFNSSSQVSWATYIGSSDDASQGFTDGITDLAFDSNNDLYVTGYGSGTDFPNVVNGNSTNYPKAQNVSTDAIITHFSNNGQIKWSTYMGANDFDYFHSIKIKGGNVYVAGTKGGTGFPLKNSGNWYYSSTVNSLSDALFVVFKNENDSLLHSTLLSGSSNHLGLSLAIDSMNVVYISGVTRSTVFPTPLAQSNNVYIETFKGVSDYFIYATAPGDTNLIWATHIGGTDDEGFWAFLHGGIIDINKQNVLHITGSSFSSVNFPLFYGDNNPYFDGTHNSSSDVTITRFNLYPINFVDNIKELNNKTTDFIVYPNPTKSSIHVKLKSPDDKTFYYIYNTLGQKIKEGILTEEINTIDLVELNPGLYIIELKQKNNKVSAKFIKHE